MRLIFGVFKRSKKEKSLRDLIKQEKKNQKKSIKQILIDGIKTLYLPSIKSAMAIIIAVIVLWIISHYMSSEICDIKIATRSTSQFILNYIFKNTCHTNLLGVSTPYISQESGHYQNLIAIHSGIGAIIFSLIIFVAEGLRDKNDKGRILLKVSYLFPLTVAEIFIFFIFIWGEVTFLSIIPIILMGIFSIWSLGSVISTLIDKHKFMEKRVELYRERFLDSLNLELEKRIGNNILIQKLSKEDATDAENKDKIKLCFHPFIPYRNKDAYYCFKSSDKGVLIEINLEALEEFSEKLEEKANKLGFSFTDAKKVKNNGQETASKEDGNATMSTTENSKIRERYIVQEFMSQIEKGDELICIDKRLLIDPDKGDLDNKIIKELQSYIPKIFTIKEKEINFDKRIAEDLGDLADECTDLINQKKEKSFESLSDFFAKIAEGFQEEMKKYGGGFSPEQAKQERNAFVGGLRTVRSLSDSVWTVFINGIKSKDVSIVRTAAYLPIRIAQQAIESKDFYIFGEFINYPLYIYKESFEKDSDKDKKEMLRDRSSRYLKETVEYFLNSKLKRDKLTYDEYKDYTIEIMKIFQQLLIESYEKNDEEKFTEVLSIIDELFSYEDHPYQIDLKRPIPKEIEEIEMRKEQVLFGVASWILSEAINNLSDAKHLRFFNNIKNRMTISVKEFTEIFSGCHQFEVEGFWGWDHWELKGHYDGRVHCIQILEKLEQFYAVRTLELLQNKSKEEIDALVLPPSRDLAFLAEGTRDLLKVLKDIEEHPEKWNKILSQNAIGKTNALRELLQKAKEKQEENDLEEKRTKPVSSQKIKEFRDETLKGFKENASMREILGYMKLISDKSDGIYKGKIVRKGINTFFDKAAFFDSWHVSFMGSGEHFGGGMATGENKILIDKIESRCKKISIKNLNKAISKLGNIKDLFILSTHHGIWEILRKLDEYESKWDSKNQLDAPQFDGWYLLANKKIPIFTTVTNDKDKILILNKRKLGLFHQYSPIENDSEKDLRRENLYIDVKEITTGSEILNKYIGNPPKWLKEEGDTEKQKKHLLEKVIIHIMQRFDLRLKKNFAGISVKINK